MHGSHRLRLLTALGAATTACGTHTYLAWGDNRDIVKNFLWPSRRHDPDVFFAKR
jgi:hypothetical protein